MNLALDHVSVWCIWPSAFPEIIHELTLIYQVRNVNNKPISAPCISNIVSVSLESLEIPKVQVSPAHLHFLHLKSSSRWTWIRLWDWVLLVSHLCVFPVSSRLSKQMWFTASNKDNNTHTHTLNSELELTSVSRIHLHSSVHERQNGRSLLLLLFLLFNSIQFSFVCAAF